MDIALDAPHWLEQKLTAIDLDELSPREAQALMYEWRKQLTNAKS
jgi:DNA mismatch repair protein MutS